MNRIIKDAVMLAAAGTAGFCAYKWMSPTDKQKDLKGCKAYS